MKRIFWIMCIFQQNKCLNGYKPLSLQILHLTSSLVGFEMLACGCGNITKSLIGEDLSVNRTQSNSIHSPRTFAGYSFGLKELLWEGDINVPTLTEKLLNCTH